MEYYRTLNFVKEPFSNSPDPALFYESRQHLEALQQLEIAVRLKRGLNVIIGDVGTGKTTLCRQLIQKISQEPAMEHSLILDPAFARTTDFLDCILKIFSGTTYLGCDDTNLKEEIKNYLFQKGVDQKKTIILMIDEGQKLPVFCLEILRELLNYETNNQKLLQIVIFAQKELAQTIAPLENFVDRINFQYELAPLGFSETKGLIDFRMNESMDRGKRNTIFTWPAYFTLYYFTKGYPRKIINLCHHVLLSLIVQNRSKAGHFFVRECALKTGYLKKSKIGVFPTLLAASMILFSMYFFNFPDLSRFWPGQTQAVEPLANPAKPAKPAEPPAQILIEKPPEPPVEKPVEPEPDTRLMETAEKQILFLKKAHPQPSATPQKAVTESAYYGALTVPQNATLSKMSEHIYGTFDKDKLALLLAHNKNLTDPDMLTVGMSLKFPVIPDYLNGWNPEHFCIVLSDNLSFKQAYHLAIQLENKAYTVRVFPSQPETGPFTYHVVINRAYKTVNSAESFKKQFVYTDQAACVQISTLISEF
ncbi:MAG: AAA family ATPase [Proteobacteria bacterium]|nr:AAA family ATPase [Pseudomonadota bacterium]MBU1386467.1 AAA family ATPase [Pseudomonadota bacterium]MBU1544578.1 AAA family ATPase [Pseudomonadota bacterium]MBU2481211.1 AAA family ATPase [Pseudomonadota bacterium]